MNDHAFAVKAHRLDWQLNQQQAQLNRLTEQVNRPRPAPSPTPRRRQSAVKEKLDKMTDHEWAALADKTQPLPDELSRQPEMLLKELGFFLLAQHIGKWDL